MVTLLLDLLSWLIMSLIIILDGGCLTVSTLGALAFALGLKPEVDLGRVWRRQAELLATPFLLCHLTEASVTAG